METDFSFAVNSFRFLSLLASGGAQEKEAQIMLAITIRTKILKIKP